MTTTYSHMEKMVRSGAQAFNARVTFTGTTLTVNSYDGADYTTGAPLLVRFPSLGTSQLTTGNLTYDFSTSSWGLPDDDGVHTIFVGLMSGGDTSVGLCTALNPAGGTVTPVTPATSFNNVTSTIAGPGSVVWIAQLRNVARVGGVWSTTTSYLTHEMGNQ